jgi:hypothetical protein
MSGAGIGSLLVGANPGPSGGGRLVFFGGAYPALTHRFAMVANGAAGMKITPLFQW